MRRFLYYPFLYFFKKRIILFKAWTLSKLSKNFNLIPDYPGSSMYLTQSIRITLDGASETFSILDKLTNKFTNQNLIFTINHQAKLKQEEICRYFDLNGSDKGSYHEYHLVYGSLLAEINKNNIVIGEIGIGSNNIRVPSNMGKSGIPGASLRSWAMLGNVTKVIGLDIDKKVLISEDKIDSYHLDQTNDKSWQALITKLNGQLFDIFIDDGLHAPFANLRTLKYASELMNEKGYIVIEDIPENALPVWNILIKLGFKDFKFALYRAKYSYMLIAKKDSESIIP